jgi:hypothetical protein
MDGDLGYVRRFIDEALHYGDGTYDKAPIDRPALREALRTLINHVERLEKERRS